MYMCNTTPKCHRHSAQNANRLILPQTIPNTPPNPPLKLLGILPPQPRRLNISGGLIVRTRQHGNHRK